MTQICEQSLSCYLDCCFYWSITTSSISTFPTTTTAQKIHKCRLIHAPEQKYISHPQAMIAATHMMSVWT